MEEITDGEIMELYGRIMKTQGLRFKVTLLSPGGWGE